MQWSDDLDRVAETRWMCYGQARKELPRFQEHIRADSRARPGDFLLAEQEGEAVGTATSMPLTMWVRGAPISCQGVAYVGTIKSARRRGGVASGVMREILRAARERKHVVSALMPFRVSFYEHFGYGVVERRSDWTIPLTVLPAGDCAGWRFAKPEEYGGLLIRQWQAAVQAGQCDVERSANRWEHLKTSDEEGMIFFNSAQPEGLGQAMAYIVEEKANDRRILRVASFSAGSPEAFVGLLSFLGTMKDQYAEAAISVPADLQVNRLLRERQVPHRPVDHATAEVRTHTRMQVRILDHRKYLESPNWPARVKGRVTIGVAECEGNISRFSLEIDSGRAKVAEASGEPDFECSDVQWAGIATGDLPASEAVRWGLARHKSAEVSELLDRVFAGPAPFCREFF